MATAIIAARNVALGEARDPWSVNEDAEYHEISKTEREAPVVPAHTEAEYAGEAKPAIAMVGDPTAALSEKVLDDGMMDDTIVQDAPPAPAPGSPSQSQSPKGRNDPDARDPHYLSTRT
jgi:hypothetical protein